MQNDARTPIEELLSTFQHAKRHFIVEIVCFSKKRPILCLRTKKKGKALWIIAGIHGEEPAGPNAVSLSLNFLSQLNVPLVIFPLCNPVGYSLNQRYPYASSYPKGVEPLTVGDADHYLLTKNKARIKKPRLKEAFLLTTSLLELSREYPPLLTIDLHEDMLSDKGYIYAQATQNHVSKKLLSTLNQHVPTYTNGTTRFGEKIKNGIIGPVTDGSIDEFLSAEKIIIKNKIVKGIRAPYVFVIETPGTLPLQKRIEAHKAILYSLKDIIQNI